MSLTKRVQDIKPSPTLEITAKAVAMKAQGIDVIGFGAGEPDFDTPENIKEAAIKALREGFTKYTPVDGIVELKDAIIEKFKRDSGLDYKRTEIIVSCGGKHSLYNIAQALFQKGDEVIIPSPYWVTFPAQVILAEATPIIIDTNEETEFKITRGHLEKNCSDKTKAIVINNPCNPTGAAYSKKELEELADFAVSKGIFIISDEIYEKIVYDGHQHTCIASLGEDIKQLTIVSNGLSKTYSMTGWRLGYSAAREDITKAMVKIQSHSTSNPTSFVQKAGVEALNGPQEAVERMVEEFKKRRDYIIKRLNSMKGISCFNPPGAFYVFPNVSKTYGKKTKKMTINNSSDFATYLLDEAKVAFVPGIAFGADDYVRISYAISMEDIEKGMDRIEKALGKLE
ncbi:MAG TPA: pyridoxal phosphate-dependent aminotransferase [Nitrospinota bacterium]|nr:pyridoxal phosphate-dependent aminotransferase [Nitrospinota bacterium]